ncbi:uncharacterized protein LOC135398188 [Ornithodoros turicata]|uniref:uncharacterized protein LOC135398188 n=1 Tax=Ornithodoros turicata TaxID=34597 RepID=UPI003139AEDE
MKIVSLLLCISLAIDANADAKIDESNRYVDKLLQQTIPQGGGVLGGSRLDGFRIKIDKKSSLMIGTKGHILINTLKEVEVNMNDGIVSGLHGLKRLGDCSPPMWQLGSVVVSCYVSLNGVTANYRGKIARKKKVSFLPTSSHEDEITAEAVMMDAKAFIEVSGAPDGQPTVSSWSVMPYHLDMSYSKSYEDVYSALKRKLRKQLEEHIRERLDSFLYGQLKRGLETAVRVDPLPMPSST